jgi:methionyl-tRNA formyltransferase
MSARSIHNLIRALTKPYVGAHFNYREREIKVWKSDAPLEAAANIEPGKIIAVGIDGVVVKCGEQAIRLLRTEPAFMPDVGEYL